MKILNMHTGLAMLLVILLHGCGGGGAGVEGGIGGTGAVVASGSITGFGSVYVNGVEYDTSSADRVVNGTSYNDDAVLHEGMVVQIKGSIDSNGLTGTATEVSYEKSLEGPVTAVAADSITVMGVTVAIDADTCVEFSTSVCTVYDSASINNNHFVEVSGYLRSDDTFYATYIEVQNVDPGNGQHSIHGTVTAVEGDQVTLNNGMLIFTWTGTPAVSLDDFIEVHGTYSGSIFEATMVEIKNIGFASNSNKMELEGIADGDCGATGVVPCEFTMQGYTIRVTSITEGGGGMAADEVAAAIHAGSKVEAEGPVTDKVMDAHEIKLKDEVRIEAEIANVLEDTNAGTKSFSFAGVDSAIQATITATAEYNSTDYASLVDGMRVRIRGRLVGGVIQVTRLDDKGTSRDVRIRGPVQAIQKDITLPRSITVIGNEFFTDDYVLKYKLEDDSQAGSHELPGGADEFYSVLQVRDIVEIQGSYPDTDNVVTWDSVEIDK